jgi:hypothetical protein
MTYPENIEEIKKFADEIGIDVKYLLGEKWKGNLDLRSAKSLPANIVFNVGGYLYLNSVKSLPANIVFNVGGYLYLYSVKSLSSSTNFNVGKGIHLPTKRKVKVIWT